MYGTGEVGVAITVTAAITFLISITAAGWPQLGMRDGATGYRGKKIIIRSVGSCLFVGTAGAVIVSVTPGHFGIALDRFSDDVAVIATIALLTVLTGAIGSCVEGVLIARRAAHLVLLDSTLGVVTRVASLFLFARLGDTGLLVASGLGCAVSSASAWILLLCFTRSDESVPSHDDSWQKDIGFVTATGVPSIVALAPAALLPTLVLNALGTEAATYFTVSLSIASAVRLIPAVMSQAVLAEAGRGVEPRALLTRALKGAGLAASAISLIIIVGAKPVTELYGTRVSDGAAPVLALLVVSGALSGVNYLIDSMLLALRQTIRFFVVNVTGSAVVFVMVGAGAYFSLVTAAAGYIAAEIVYAAIGWWMLRTSDGWRRTQRTATASPPEKSIDLVQAGDMKHERGVIGLPTAPTQLDMSP